MTVIFDMHGIIFCHSSDFNIRQSEKLFEEKIREYSSTSPQYKKAGPNYKKGNFKLALEIEKKSIIKGLKGDLSELQIYEMPQAVDRILKYHKSGYRVVFVATSEIETTRKILTFLLKKHQIKSLKAVLASFDIINMANFGSKRDTNAWKKVLKRYKNISDIYEDREENLKAGALAAKQLGNQPRLHTSV